MFLSYSTSVLINIDIKISIKINIDNLITCYSISKYSISYHLMFNHQELFQPFSETMLQCKTSSTVSVRVTVQQGSSNCRSNDNDSTILVFLQFKCAARQNSRAVHTTTLRIIFGNDLSKAMSTHILVFPSSILKKNLHPHENTKACYEALSRACQTNRWQYNLNRKAMLANQKPEKVSSRRR